MCLAMPMEIIEIIDHNRAYVARGEERLEINISLLENPMVGSYAIIHAGYAIKLVESEDALERQALFAEFFRSEHEQ